MNNNTESDFILQQHDLDRCTMNEKKPKDPEQEKPPAPAQSPDLVTSHTSKV